MKVLGRAALAAAILMASAGTAAAEGWVAGVRGGALVDIDFDDSVYLAGAFGGYDFADDGGALNGNWRLQGEFWISSESAGGFEVTYFTFMPTVYREFDTGSRVRPYLVLGTGGTHIDANFGLGSTWFFTLQTGAGLAIDLAENWAVDLDYRVNLYQNDGDSSATAETAEVSAYLRYAFGGN